jgi:hypothetical protein
MRKLNLLAIAALGAFAQAADAGLIVDTVTFDANGIVPSSDSTPAVLNGYGSGAVNKLDGLLSSFSLDFVSWTHNFTLPADAKLTSGVLALGLEDDGNDGIEIGFGFTDSGQWDVGIVSTGTYQFDIDLNSLLDGALKITLLSAVGDFLIKSSELRVNYKAVPEPAMLSLMGLGVLAAAFGYRRRAKNA